MNPQNLKNYGLSLAEASTVIPGELINKVKKASMNIMLKRLGIMGMLRFWLILRSEEKRLMQHDYVAAREHGLTQQSFIVERVKAAAVFAKGDYGQCRIFNDVKHVALSSRLTGLRGSFLRFQGVYESW